jgi:hypothetical protein
MTALWTLLTVVGRWVSVAVRAGLALLSPLASLPWAGGPGEEVASGAAVLCNAV